jgi:acyl dehydratase
LNDGLGRNFIDPQDKYWDDFERGDVMVARGRTIDMGDIANFTNLTGDFYPIHIDQEFAKKSLPGMRRAGPGGFRNAGSPAARLRGRGK